MLAHSGKSSRAETSHMDPRPLNEPTAKPHLEAVCMPARYLKTGIEHLSTIVGPRIIQVAGGGVPGHRSGEIQLQHDECEG
jgi:hypothetical protein